MFSFHKPRVYRSTEGCCICRAKSSSSRFTDSKKYEDDSVKCFNLEKPRQGEICNACVLLVKRFKRLPSGSNRHWGHVVDARIGPGMKSISKFKKMKEEMLNQQNLENGIKPNVSKVQSIPEKFCKIFKKIKKKRVDKLKLMHASRASWYDHPESPESFNSDIDENHHYNNLFNNNGLLTKSKRRKSVKPSKYIKRARIGSFLDEFIWNQIFTCCGIAYENKQFGALLIDSDKCSPCFDHIKEFFKVDSNNISNIKTELFIGNNELSRQKIMPSTTHSNGINNTSQALKKHHIFYKRQMENFPKVEQKMENLCNTTIKDNTLSNKMKFDKAKTVRHSLERIIRAKFKSVDINPIINGKIDDRNLKKPIIAEKYTQSDGNNTKFNDNSSDSGFDENLQDQKIVNNEQEDNNKNLLLKQTNKGFTEKNQLVQCNQPQTSKLNGITRQTYAQLNSKLAQNNEAQKVRAILNSNSEGLLSIAANLSKTSNNMINNTVSTAANLNQKIILVKANYNSIHSTTK